MKKEKVTKKEIDDFFFFGAGAIEMALSRGDLVDVIRLFAEFKEDARKTMYEMI